MAIGLDGAALDRGGDAGGRQRLPTIEGSQATTNAPCRSASTSNERLNSRRPCSPSQRRVTSTSAATASQCSTKTWTSPKLTLKYTGAKHGIPRYSCSRAWMDNGAPHCIAFGGLRVDDAIENALLAVVGPGAIAAATAAEKEAGQRRGQGGGAPRPAPATGRHA